MIKYIKWLLLLVILFISACSTPYYAVYEVEPIPRYVYRNEPECRQVMLYTDYGYVQARKCRNVLVKRMVTNRCHRSCW